MAHPDSRSPRVHSSPIVRLVIIFVLCTIGAIALIAVMPTHQQPVEYDSGNARGTVLSPEIESADAQVRKVAAHWYARKLPEGKTCGESGSPADALEDMRASGLAPRFHDYGQYVEVIRPSHNDIEIISTYFRTLEACLAAVQVEQRQIDSLR